MLTNRLTLLRLGLASGLCFGPLAKPVRGQNPAYAEWPDNHWAEIARGVPGFAGWWLQGGTIVLMLVDTAQRDAAIRAIGAELPRRYRNNIRVHKADFNFDQLRKWKSLALGDSAVVSSDADEVRNRLVVEIADSGALAATRQRLVEMGIPSEALIIEISGPAKWLQQSRVAPPNLRLKLSARWRRIWWHAHWKPSFFLAAPAGRSLSASR